MSNKIQLIDIPTKSRKIFFHYVGECNKKYRKGHDLSLYRKIIGIHRENNNLDLLLDKEELYPFIHKTLGAWNMNQRGARLASVDTIKDSILSNRQNLIELYRYHLNSINKQQIFDKILPLLEKVFYKLTIMKSKRRLVGVSKTLHFLIPDLVMPIDNKYTMTFFKLSVDPTNEFKTFEEIFLKTYRITKGLFLNQDDYNGTQWNTSIPKLIDNAIIGFHRYIKEHDVKEVITQLEVLSELSNEEKNNIKMLLQKQKDKEISLRKQKVKELLILQKAKEAGIEVTNEEIEEYLGKKKDKFLEIN